MKTPIYNDIHSMYLRHGQITISTAHIFVSTLYIRYNDCDKIYFMSPKHNLDISHGMYHIRIE